MFSFKVKNARLMTHGYYTGVRYRFNQIVNSRNHEQRKLIATPVMIASVFCLFKKKSARQGLASNLADEKLKNYEQTPSLEYLPSLAYLFSNGTVSLVPFFMVTLT